MRSNRDEAMRRHPSSGVAVIDGSNAEVTRPYKEFIDALDEFAMAVSLHGPGSTEAHLARARVRSLRDTAAEAWRSGLAAA